MLKNTRIITRLLLGFGLVLGLLLAVGGGGIWSMKKMELSMADISEGYQTVEYSQRLRANVNQLRRFEADVFLNVGTPEKAATYKKEFDETVERYNKRFNALEKIATDPKEKELTAGIKQNFSAYINGVTGVFDRIGRGEITNKDDAIRQMDAVREAPRKVETLVLELADKNSKMWEHC